MAYDVHMIASSFRSGFVLAVAAGLIASSGPAQDQLDAYRDQLSRMPATADASGGIAGSIAQWKALSQSGGFTFDAYSAFLLAHPGWPGEAGLRRAAEKSLETGPAAPAVIVGYFQRFPPMTSAGRVRFADALAAVGRRAEAQSVARDAWVQGSLSVADEARVLAAYSAALSPADHDARMDRLLWAGATTAAARQVVLVSPSRRDLFEARLAFRTNAADAADRMAATQDRYGDNAGYLADRATWLRNNDAGPAARALLSRPHMLAARPANVEAWYELLLANARAAVADGDYGSAYNIARQIDDAYPQGIDISDRPYGERDDYTSLAWLAGRTAMTALARPGDAIGLFQRYAGGSRAPQTRSKGYYWAGRAAEAAGRMADATGWYRQAAVYRDQFYGQLATERLGLSLTPPPDIVMRPVDPALRTAFYMRETVRAARYLGATGAHEDQTAFVRQIATDAKTDADHVLATELSRTLGRPDLGVMIGRSALANGLPDYAATGFPRVSVPETEASAWTIIHAIARQESQFDRAAVSRVGARGLMQLMPGTAREQAGKLGLAYDSTALTGDPAYNIQLGSSYFQRLYINYGSYPLAIAAYNAGPGNVGKWLRTIGDPRAGQIDMIDWIEAIPLSETRNYVQRVLENAVVYDLLNPQYARSQGSARMSWYLGRPDQAAVAASN